MRKLPRSRAGTPKFQHTLPRNLQQLRSADWPDVDRAQWMRAQVREDPFDSMGRLVDLQPRTIKTIEQSYGSYLAWLDSRIELFPVASVYERLTPERVGGYILDMRKRCRASTVDIRLVYLKMALRAMEPDRDWGWITRHPLRPSTKEIRASRKPITQQSVI